MEVVTEVTSRIAPHPAVAEITLVGSRATGRAIPESDWDFAVVANDFPAVARSLPDLLAPLRPLAQQWDRLSHPPPPAVPRPGPAPALAEAA